MKKFLAMFTVILIIVGLFCGCHKESKDYDVVVYSKLATVKSVLYDNDDNISTLHVKRQDDWGTTVFYINGDENFYSEFNLNGFEPKSGDTISYDKHRVTANGITHYYYIVTAISK